ncbi:MAG: hypothetical protein AAGA62_19205, partial [Bacteroidota bacterium]
MRYIFLSILLLGYCSPGNGQGLRPYQPENGPTAALLTFGGSLTLGSSYLGSKVEPLSLEQLGQLNPDGIWPIDRYSLGRYDLAADEWTDKLLVA